MLTFSICWNDWASKFVTRSNVILEVADIFGADLSLVVENEVVATDDSRTIRLASFKRVVMMYVKYMVSIVAFVDNVVRTRRYQITPESVVLTAPLL